MDTFREYIQNLNESRYKTHGVQHVKKIFIPLLSSLNLSFDLDINKATDDFQLYIFNNGNFDKEIFDIIISRSEILGYFPSILLIDKINIFNEFKKYVKHKHKVENNKKDVDFVEYLRTLEFNDFKEIYIQFESWQDTDLKEIPGVLYHVCRTIDLTDIKRYGLSPKSKNKISYHPDRIYVTVDIKEAEQVIGEFKKIDNIDYTIIKILPDEELKGYLKLKKDPNWTNGYYTTQNISPLYIQI